MPLFTAVKTSSWRANTIAHKPGIIIGESTLLNAGLRRDRDEKGKFLNSLNRLL